MLTAISRRRPLSGHRHCGLPGSEPGVAVLHIGEEMAVDVEGHLDQGVTEQHLQALRREALLDRPGREEVAQAV